jgi:hypothetical protein
VSFAATLSAEQFLHYFSDLRVDGEHVFGVYGMCFLLAVVMNHMVSAKVDYKMRVPFIMDTGNNYKHHVLESYGSIIRNQLADDYHLGSLTFSDDSLNALQAADVIAWAARRKMVKDFPIGFEPLADIFNDSHWDHPISDVALINISKNLRAKLNR